MDKKRHRPFSKRAKIKNRGCSQKLQRAVCDLGADSSFEQTTKKLQEHYGVELCIETVRKVTEKHAKRALEFNWKKKGHSVTAKQLIAEDDGSMVPIVEILKGTGDARKRRVLSWKEYRLAAIQKAGEIGWLYAVAYGSVNAVGDSLAIISERAGFGEKTEVHGLGDGAIWVREQMERVFGCQLKFLIDFFHLCDYLSAAGDIFGEGKAAWMEKTKDDLKKGQIENILKELKQHEERSPDCKELKDCIRYIENRESQFAYDEALAKGLPIGSGKIESSHRNIIQQRMKKPGAWWKTDLAESMINLRALRANGDWNKFWEEETYKGMAA
jgi:hypothetical protein